MIIPVAKNGGTNRCANFQRACEHSLITMAAASGQAICAVALVLLLISASVGQPAGASNSPIVVHIDWAAELTRTRTAATFEIDVMPFLGRTDWGGPFEGYKTALQNLGAEFVRMAPWWPNPRVVVTELTPSDCTATKPATNWNSTRLDQVMEDFYQAVCGPQAKQGACEKSVIQQWSTWPSYMFTDGFKLKDLDPRPWVPNMTGSVNSVYGLEGSKLQDPSCGQIAR